ncbi:MAG TPA: thioredoxin domain-containing protein [Bacteroidales bacterium]
MEQEKNYKYTNELINETSPYLLQHAHNPVNWYPWGPEALNKAKAENKMLLISIGYAACHWCHVMEHESFEDEQVAAIMNENFVCIKVDREERPDIDHQYMDAVQLMTGRGGWPLNCFALPDGRPFFGGTYFRKEQWISILNQLSEMYANDYQKILQSAEQLSAGLTDYNLVQVNNENVEFDKETIRGIVNNWKKYFDKENGGNAGAPKFPMPNNFLFLLDYYYFTEDEEVKNHIELSLDKMAAGGIYDQLGGGFARYSTDAVWKAPHFEKMLYDNAQLVSCYSKAYTLFKKPEYQKVVYETLSFLERELYSPEDAFYSSIDADSEGEEGLFYVWNKKEIVELLGENADLFESFYNITDTGNWENGKNILYSNQAIIELANMYEISVAETEKSLEDSKKTLSKARKKRVRPITDDKILTSWNALAITAYVDAYRVFGEKRFLEIALKTANFIKNNRINEEGKVLRITKKEGSSLNGFLDDYSFLAASFIDLYQATFDEKWLLLAEKITQYAITNFYDSKSGMFQFTELSDKEIIFPKTEISDNVIPSSNSSMAKVLNSLSLYFENEDFERKSSIMLNTVLPQMERNGAYFSNWGILLCNQVFQPREVVFCGNKAHEFRKEFDKLFQVSLIAGSESYSDMPLLENRFVEGKTYIYVCMGRACKLPVQSVKEALREMEN